MGYIVLQIAYWLILKEKLMKKTVLRNMKRSIPFIFCFFAFFVFSCAIFDDASDVIMSVNPPDEITIFNNAFVSTLRSIDGKIMRSGTAVYTFHFDVDIPANNIETVKIDDFIMQEGDKPRITKADFTHDM